MRSGQVALGDIAVMEKGYLKPPATHMHVNGKRAIGIGISTDPQRDVVQTGEHVKRKINELLPLMPLGLELQSLYLDHAAEKHLSQLPQVKTVSVTFGSTPLRYYLASTSVGPKPNFANLLVELTDSKYSQGYEEAFDTYMKANFPDAIARTSLFKLSPAVDAAIEIGFIGPNPDTLISQTNQALSVMHQHPELIHIRNSWGNKVPVWTPLYSPERAQPLNVSRQNMAQSIQIGTSGMTLGEYREGDQQVTCLEQVVSGFDFQYRFANVKDYNRQLVMMAQCDPRRGTNAIAAFNEVWKEVQHQRGDGPPFDIFHITISINKRKSVPE